MPDIVFPEDLANLPVARSIKEGEIPTDESFVLVAHTGSGKTMLIPPVIALRGHKVILRQPTRQTAKLTYLGLTKFWSDQLSIGFHTSEETVGSLDECDIMVCTDGVMKNWLRDPKYRLTVIIDEFHWQQAITEIELALVKTYLNQGKNFNLVLLSATIRPSNVINYFENLNPHPVGKDHIEKLCDVLDNQGSAVNTMEQGQWLKIFYSEGVAYPIEDRISAYLEETPAEVGTVMEFAQRMLEENSRGLVFLCTRAEVQQMCNLIRKKIPELAVEFAHADVKIENILKFVHEHEPSVLFATVSLATSATLPFDEVLIIDKGIDTVYEHGFEKQVTNIPIDNNGILQRRGRCGRVKPGVCTLATNHEEHPDWGYINPTAIKPPLEKVAPIQAALVCAMYEIDPRNLDTLSDLNPRDIDISVRRLCGMGVAYEDEGTLKLTKLGRKVASLPLEVELAVTVAKCDDDILPAVIAIASCDQGVYGMFQPHIEIEGQDETVEGISLLHPDLINKKSVLLTKAKIIQAAYKARADPDTTLEAYASTNGMWPKKIEKILFKYYQICVKGLGKSERKMREQFLAMDIDALTDRIINYLFELKMFEEAYFRYDVYKDKGGYKGEISVYFAILDGLDMKLLGLDINPIGELRAIGTKKIIKSRSGNEICIFGDTTIIPMDMQYDEDWR